MAGKGGGKGGKGRRGNGEGSVRLRPDGRWESRLRLPGSQGGERISVYGATRQEVTDEAARVLRDARLGVSVADGRQRYDDYLAHWLEMVAQGQSESLYATYESAIRLHITPVIGSVRLMDITPYHIERVYTQMLAEGLRSLGIVGVIMRASLGVAELHGLVARNVARLVRRPTEERHRSQAFDPEQARRYLAVCADASVAELGPMLAVMLWTGLRMGEASALHWRDVQLATSSKSTPTPPAVRVEYTMRHRHGDPVFTKPKTDLSRRSVRLTPAAVEILRAWRKTQREQRLLAGAAWRTSFKAVRPGHEGEEIDFADLVFTDAIGRPRYYSVVTTQHRRICRVAEVPLIRPHDLRHSCATLLLSTGVNAIVVSEMLGHSSISMTLGIYGHVQPDMQADAIERLSKLLS